MQLVPKMRSKLGASVRYYLLWNVMCNTPGVTQSPGQRSTLVSYSHYMLEWKVKELKVRGMVKISINHNKKETLAFIQCSPINKILKP